MNQTAGHDLLESTSASTESDECGLVYSVTDIIVASVIGVIVALIIILNTLCLWVLRRVKNINDTTKVFLYSLTFSDLMVGIFPGIPTVVLLASKSWPFGEFLCTVHAMFGHYTHGTSIYSLLLLTVDRYVSVVFSLRYPSLVTVVRARITVCSIWIIFFLVLTVYGFVAEWDYRIVDPILKCGWSVRHGVVYNSVAIAFLIFALAIFLTLYAHMFAIARRQRRRIANQAQIASAVVDIAPPQQHRIMINRGTKTVFIVTIMFAVTVIPAIVILNSIEESSTSFDVTNFSSYALLLSSNWINVVIYFLRNREFQQEARRMITLCSPIANHPENPSTVHDSNEELTSYE